VADGWQVIEKLWDVVLARMNRELFRVLSGEANNGQSRPFTLPDLIKTLQDARLTRHAFDDIFTREY
jgi:hypothetical protein